MSVRLAAGSYPEIRTTFTPWEARAAEAVANTVEFWGFKANHGRVWALLYLRGVPMTATAIQTATGLSKGAVSMVISTLEQWQVVRRLRKPGALAWSFEAETDLLQMIRKVISSREAAFVAKMEAELLEAERQAAADPSIDEDVLKRIARMRVLAQRTSKAVRVFLKTSQLDVRSMAGILAGGVSLISIRSRS